MRRRAVLSYFLDLEDVYTYTCTHSHIYLLACSNLIMIGWPLDLTFLAQIREHIYSFLKKDIKTITIKYKCKSNCRDIYIIADIDSGGWPVNDLNHCYNWFSGSTITLLDQRVIGPEAVYPCFREWLYKTCFWACQRKCCRLEHWQPNGIFLEDPETLPHTLNSSTMIWLNLIPFDLVQFNSTQFNLSQFNSINIYQLPTMCKVISSTIAISLLTPCLEYIWNLLLFIPLPP